MSLKSALKSRKRISYFHYNKETDQVDEVKIYIEQVLNAAYGCYVWPSALVLILEVGAGTCLPSLTIIKSSKPSHMVVTDIESIVPAMQQCLELNQVSDNVWIGALEWGQFGTPNSIDYLIQHTIQTEWDSSIDYIIGSDTFYDPKEFENLLVLVSYVIHHHNPHCTFYTTYQERSSKRSIQYLLNKWNLQCRLISKDAFGFDELKYTCEQDAESEIKVNAGTLSSVFLLEISKAKQ